MSPQNATGGQPASQPPMQKISTATEPQDRDERTAELGGPVAFGTKFLAAGAATFDWVVVRRCPICGFAHLHRLLGERDAQIIERAPSCAPWRTYQVRISDVVPVPGSRREVA